MKRGTNLFALIGYITTGLVVTTFAYVVSTHVTSLFFGTRITNTATIQPSLTPPDVWCNRATPYPMSPEFQRALSIIIERVGQQNQKLPNSTAVNPKKYYYNCLDIQYADLSQQQTEGEFLFDPSSSPDDLKILVDNSYQEYDDYLTAILLSHEVTHAYQFLQEHFDGVHTSCYDKEVQAFTSERNLFADFNQEEQASLIAKIEYNPNKNSAYAGLNAIFQINVEAAQECGLSANTCYFNSINRQITQMVESNPFYQQECAGQ